MSPQRTKKKKIHSFRCKQKSSLSAYSREALRLKKINEKLHSQIFYQKKTISTLQHHASKFGRYLDFSNAILMVLDRYGKVAFVNAYGAKILGYPKKDILGKRWFRNFVPARIRPAVETVFHLLIKRKIKPSGEYYENPIVNSRGEERIIRWHNTVLKNAKGEIEGALSTGQDITEKRRAEDALRKKQLRYHAIFEQTYGFIGLMKPDGTLLEANKTALQFAGVKASEVLGKVFWKTAWWKHSKEAQAKLRVAIKKAARGEFIRFETTVSSRYGDSRPIDFSLKPVRDVQGKVVLLIPEGRDIAERKAMEELLRENEEKFRSVAEQSPNMIFINQGGRIIYANKKCEEIMGYKIEEFYSPRFNFLNLIHPEQVPMVRRNFRTHQGGKEVPPYEYKLLTKDHKTLHAILTSKLIHLKTGPAILSIITDITERQWAETEQKQSLSLLKATLESTADGILVVSQWGRITGYNEQFRKMWNIPKPIIVSHDDKKLLAFVLNQLKEPKKFLSRIEWLYAHPEENSFDTLVFKDGRVFERYSRPQRLEGRVVGRVWSFREVTLRRNMEIGLAASAVRFRRLFEAARDGILILNSKTGQVLEVNHFLIDMLGYSRGEFLGKKLWQLSAFKDTEKCRMAFHLLQKKGYIHYEDFPLRTKKGEAITAEFVSNSYFVGQEKVIQCNIRDITDRKRALDLLHQRESYLSAIIENQPGMVWLKDKKGKFLAVNHVFAQACGLQTATRVVGKTDLDIWPLALARKYRTDDQKVMRRKGSMAVEEPIYDRGVRKWYETFKTAVLDKTGSVIGTSGYAYDVTERKTAALALLESEEKFRSVAEQSPNMIFIHLNGRVLYVNKVCEKVLGYKVKEIYAPDFNFLNLVHSDDLALARRNLRSHREGKEVPACEYRVKTKKGQLIYCILATKLIHYANERAVMGVITDVTERKQAEKDLRQREGQYRSLVEMSPEAIFINYHNKIVFANPQAIQLFGASSPKEIVGRSPFDFFHPSYHSKMRERIRRLLKGKSVPMVETRVLRLDRQVIDVEVVASRFRYQEDFAIQVLLRDITERKRAEKALRDSEFRLRESQRVSLIGSYELDVKAGVWKSSETLDAIFGIPPSYKKDVKGWENILHPDHRKAMAGYLQKDVLIQKKPFNREYKICRQNDGQIRWVIGRGSLILDPRGKPLKMIGTIQDITERKNSEEEIKKMASVVEHSDELINLATPDGKMVFLNKAGGKMLGLDPNNIKRTNIRQVFQKAMREKVEKEVLPVLKKGGSWKGELQYLNCKTGKTTDVQAMTFAIKDPHTGRVVHLANVSLDITARKQAEDALQKERHQLFQIIDTVPHMIFAKDKSGRFLLVNKAVGDMYGMNPKDLIGKKRQDVHKVAEEVAAYLEIDRMILASGLPRIVAAERFTDVHGNVHILQTIKIPFKMQGIEDTVILGVSVDVTEQKKVEEFRNDVIRTISHELRTPLSIEKEGINLLLDGAVGSVNADQKMLLEAIMKNIKRLSRMIDSLLDVAHIETRKLQLKRNIVDLRDIVRDVVFEFRTKIREKKMQLTVDLPKDTVPVFVDQDKIIQVLSNLMDNAVRFTKEGTIHVFLEVLQNEVECSVRDTGAGIAPEHLHHIFEKFQQFGRAVGPGEKGLGLGLSIAKGLIELQHGRIWAKSELGVGTKMTFALPLYNEKGV